MYPNNGYLPVYGAMVAFLWNIMIPCRSSSCYFIFLIVEALYLLNHSHLEPQRCVLGREHHQNMGDIFKGIDIKFIGIYATCWGCIIGTYCASRCLGSSFHTSHKPITQGVVLRQHPASDDVRQLGYLRNYVWFLAAVWDYSCESRGLSFSRGFVLRRIYLVVFYSIPWHRNVADWSLSGKTKTILSLHSHPDSKVHGANMGPTWVLSAPDGPHVDPMNLAIRATSQLVVTMLFEPWLE